MSDEPLPEEAAMNAAAEETPKKRGPKSRADIEAELREQIERETRERLEAEMRERVEADVRAQIEREEAEAKAIREAEGKAVPVSGTDLDGDPTKEGAVTINFVDDGFTILGKVWYSGETLTLNPETQNWEDSIIEFQGEKRLFASLDEDEQIVKWGRRFFRPGAGSASGYALLLENPDLTDAERAQLQKAARLHEERYGALAK